MIGYLLSLKNDYNGSFGVENIALDTNNVSDKDFTIEVSSETESEINDVNIDDAKIVNKSLTKEGNSFKFSVDVSSNIYASTVKKTIKAKNYFTPVASTTSEYLTYNVYFDDGRLYYMPTFFGLGMSSGGRDNNGGGGVLHIKGLVDLGLSSDTFLADMISELEEKTKLLIKDMITNSVINNIKNLEFDFIY